MTVSGSNMANGLPATAADACSSAKRQVRRQIIGRAQSVEHRRDIQAFVAE
jgi:hypothetical protein